MMAAHGKNQRARYKRRRTGEDSTTGGASSSFAERSHVLSFVSVTLALSLRL